MLIVKRQIQKYLGVKGNNASEENDKVCVCVCVQRQRKNNKANVKRGKTLITGSE